MVAPDAFSEVQKTLSRGSPFNKWFAVRFAALLGIMYVFMEIEAVHARLLGPWARLTAFASVLLLDHLGITAALDAFTITGKGGAIGIEPECAAAGVYAVFISAVAAVRAPLSKKMFGISAGVAAISAVNILRICVLFLLLPYGSAAFNLFHLYIGQALVIAVTFAVWAWWLPGGGPESAEGYAARRHIMERTCVFFGALILSLWLHGKFLNSAMGAMFVRAVSGHALALLRFAGATPAASGQQWLTLTSCLAPPISVLYLAVAAAWPVRTLNKTGLLLLFFPLLYILGIVKMAAIYLSPAEAVTRGFVYNQYYPAVFTFLLATFILFSFHGPDRKAGARAYGKALVGLALGVALWHFLGGAYKTYLLMPCAAALSGYRGLAMNPYQALSSIPAWHIILTMAFFSFPPGGEWRGNVRRCAGLLALFFILQAALFSFFNLYPIAFRAGYLRMFGIAPPFSAWLVDLWRAKKRMTAAPSRRAAETMPS